MVGTPIGNLGDLSPRAVGSLASADVVYCEDTRHSRKLLTHAGISGVPLRSLHGHNEGDRVDEVVAAVAAGRTVALVSDAGMPAVSRIRGRRRSRPSPPPDCAVTVVPGPSAVLAALVASGLATDRFCFEGFLPRSGRDRAERLAAVASESRTTVLFEAPVRTAATLRDLAAACGPDRPVAVARELTKLHEEVWRGTLADGRRVGGRRACGARSSWWSPARRRPGRRRWATTSWWRRWPRRRRPVPAPGARSTGWPPTTGCPAAGSTSWPCGPSTGSPTRTAVDGG